MSKDEILNIVKSATYFDDTTRQKWMTHISSMTPTQLDEFAKLINWAEEQKQNLEFESALVESGFYQFFAALKYQGLKMAKKETYARAEARSKAKEEKKSESLLNTDEK